MHDLIVIGAGPAGLAVAAVADKKGFKTVLLEKGCIANSLVYYPSRMRFYSRADQMALAGIPFICRGGYPTRDEAVTYFQTVARCFSVDIALRHRVTEVLGSVNAFLVKAEGPNGRQLEFRGKRVIITTGAFDTPRQLYIPGEELPKVSHYYNQPYQYEGSDVVVVGGGDSAAEATLELIESNAQVTLVYRKQNFTRLRPWTQAALENAIDNERLTFFGGSLLKEIREDTVLIWIKERGVQAIHNDFALLLTGYSPDIALLKRAGITIDDGASLPAYFEESLETNVAGMYLAGAVCTGTELGKQGFHSFPGQGERIVHDILSKM